MLTVAVTGPMGTGKSTVLSCFAEKKHPVRKADDIARSLIVRNGPFFEDFQSLFGPACLDKTGEWDRKALARQIFENPEKKRQMEALLHPRVRREFEKFRQEQEARGAELIFYEIPLVTDSISHKRFDRIVFVSARETIVTRRLLKGGMEERDINLRLTAQKPRSSIMKTADFVIYNEGELRDLKSKAERVLEILQKTENGGVKKLTQRSF